jgi:hypothetical protein
MSSPKCRSVEVINNPHTKGGSINGISNNNNNNNNDNNNNNELKRI